MRVLLYVAQHFSIYMPSWEISLVCVLIKAESLGSLFLGGYFFALESVKGVNFQDCGINFYLGDNVHFH